MLRYCAALAAMALTGASALLAQPAVEARPSHVLEGEPVQLVISGLRPGQPVTLHASRIWALYPKGQELYRGQASFVADRDGRVDLSSAAPTVGSSYNGPDASGPFWSMAPIRRDEAYQQHATALGLAGIDGREPGTILLEAESGGKVIARGTVLLDQSALGVETSEIRDSDVVAVFARGDGPAAQPALILLGGSEGGLITARELAPLLASHGYAVLGLGYFQGADTELQRLKPNLELIPLETIEAARHWLANRPGVDAQRIGIIGISKGAELALLAAAKFDWVKAVAAFAPSHVVWEGIPPDDRPGPAGSSWTYRAKPLRYVRWSLSAEKRGDLARKATGISRLTEVHLESLAEHAGDIELARIQIEESEAAIFIAAGHDDGMWPSAYSAEQIRARLARHTYKHPVQVEFVSTGHQILGTGWGPTTAFQRPKGRLQGGTAQLDAEAQRLLWPKLLKFLEQQLRPAPAVK